MFEKAARLKLRFDTKFGRLAAEDLWDLSEKDLNELYMGYAADAKESDVESLMDDSVRDTVLALQMEIVRYVFETRKAERLAQKAKMDAKARLGRLLEIKAQKQDEAFLGMSEAELDAAIAELQS